MEGPHIYPGLRRRVLVAAVQTQRRGDPPPDWDGLFPSDEPPVEPAAINRALTSLAEAGLVSGVWTSEGWLQIQPTARGVAQAGRAAQPERGSVRAPIALTTGLLRAWNSASERVRQHSGTMPLAAQAPITDSGPTVANVPLTREAPARQPAASPAPFSTLRSQMAQVWRTFTTFP